MVRRFAGVALGRARILESPETKGRLAVSVARDAGLVYAHPSNPGAIQFTPSTPGSHIETKSASIAWHYRRAQCDFGARQAHELRMLLGDALSNQPCEVLEGQESHRGSAAGVSKALVAGRVQNEMTGDSQLIAIGDDRTDDELFQALPPSSVTIAVGTRPNDARFRVADYRAVRHLLRGILADTEASRPASRNLQPKAASA